MVAHRVHGDGDGHADPFRRRDRRGGVGQARPDTQQVLDGLVAGVLGGAGWGATFLGPLALLFGMIGMLVTTVVLFMRSSLLYLVAAFAPLVWSSSVSPMMRGGVRRMVHVAVALVLAKPAIVISLAVGMQLHRVGAAATAATAGCRRGRRAADRVLLLRGGVVVAVGGVPAAALGRGRGGVVGGRRWMGGRAR